MTHKNNSGKPAAIVRGRHSGYLATGRASNGAMRAGPNPMTYLQQSPSAGKLGAKKKTVPLN